MPTFSYTAMDATGRVVKGEIDATDYEEAVGSVRRKNLFPTKVREKASATQMKKKTSTNSAALDPRIATIKQSALASRPSRKSSDSFPLRLLVTIATLYGYSALAVGWSYHDMEFHLSDRTGVIATILNSDANPTISMFVNAVHKGTMANLPRVQTFQILTVGDAITNARAIFASLVSGVATLWLLLTVMVVGCLVMSVESAVNGSILGSLGYLLLIVAGIFCAALCAVLYLVVWLPMVSVGLAFQHGTTGYTIAYCVAMPVSLATAGFT